VTFIKFCGMTRAEDVAHACELGVDAVGFVLWPKSPRAIDATKVSSLVKMLPPSMEPVGVFVAPTRDEVQAGLDAGIRVLQIHAWDSATQTRWPASTWLAASASTDLAAVPATMTVLLDAHDPDRQGGTGCVVDWSWAAKVAAERRVVLAGGLTPANVGAAIHRVQPYGVDVASGIETRPGIKSAEAMAAFVAAVREADQR
jgi:phosphoribosylanthranilate isomerase